MNLEDEEGYSENAPAALSELYRNVASASSLNLHAEPYRCQAQDADWRIGCLCVSADRKD